MDYVKMYFIYNSFKVWIFFKQINVCSLFNSHLLQTLTHWLLKLILLVYFGWLTVEYWKVFINQISQEKDTDLDHLLMSIM